MQPAAVCLFKVNKGKTSPITGLSTLQMNLQLVSLGQPGQDLPSHKPCSWQRSFICLGNRHLCSEILPEYDGRAKSSVEVPLDFSCHWKTVPANQFPFFFQHRCWEAFRKTWAKPFVSLIFFWFEVFVHQAKSLLLKICVPLFYFSTSYYMAAFITDKWPDHD